MHRTSRKVWTGIASVILAAGVVAAVLMFTHQAPFVPALGMTTNCTDLAANPASVLAGSSGFIRMTCAGAAAFSTVVDTTAVPTFSLPSGYTALWVYKHASPPTTSCADGGGATQLTSGGSVSWPASTDWSYCVVYANAPG